MGVARINGHGVATTSTASPSGDGPAGRRNVDESPAVVSVRHCRGTLRECRELAPGAAERPLVQELPAREHQGDDEADSELVEGERSGHCEQRDDVGAELPMQHPADDPDRERYRHRSQDECPHDIGPTALAQQAHHDTARQRAPDGYGKQVAPHILIVRWRPRRRIGLDHRPLRRNPQVQRITPSRGRTMLRAGRGLFWPRWSVARLMA